MDFRREFGKKCDTLPTMWAELNPELITMSKKANRFERSSVLTGRPRFIPTPKNASTLRRSRACFFALRDKYESIVSGYHKNKRHLNNLVIDGSLPAGVVRELIDHS